MCSRATHGVNWEFSLNKPVTSLFGPGSHTCGRTFWMFVGKHLDIILSLLCSDPTQWSTAASWPQWRTRCCCQSQAPLTAAWPRLSVRTALSGGAAATALCAELMVCGKAPTWSVKVTKVRFSPQLQFSTLVHVCFLCYLAFRDFLKVAGIFLFNNECFSPSCTKTSLPASH